MSKKNSFITSNKVGYHIKALLLFLETCKDGHTIPREFADKAKTACLQLLDKVNQDPVNTADELNHLIQEMNFNISVPYPILMTDSMENLVKSEIAAFEHFLNQELKANHLQLKDEVRFFEESLQIWEQIGVSLSPVQGIDRMIAIIENANKLLPKERKYPSPDSKNYFS